MAVSSSIFLVGFMGSGKTTLGKKLASKLKMKFVDLDEAICIRTEFATIKELIAEKGFDFFRQEESETLKTLLPEGKIVSTGGGTPCYFDNLPWMKSKGKVVFLQVDEGVLFSRLMNTDMEERPMLKNLDEQGLKSFIHDKLEERMPFYTQAHHTFNPVKNDVTDLITELKDENQAGKEDFF
ncbi:MAG: shikimate kinase [Bacteroidota bacterium]